MMWMAKKWRQSFVSVIRVYQKCLSPFLGAHCRFMPTCSEYAIQAIEMHGVTKGLCLFGRRFVRCHPWGHYGYDPVPSPRHALEQKERT